MAVLLLRVTFDLRRTLLSLMLRMSLGIIRQGTQNRFRLKLRNKHLVFLEEMMENEDGDIFEVIDPHGESEQKVISEMQITTFAEQSITENNREILKIRMDGADKGGYKTASAVHKRIAQIVGAYGGLCNSGVLEVLGQVNRRRSSSSYQNGSCCFFIRGDFMNRETFEAMPDVKDAKQLAEALWFS